jgi:hypothetical protein
LELHPISTVANHPIMKKAKKNFDTKSISIRPALKKRVMAKARSEERSFSYIARRAIQREMAGRLLDRETSRRTR